jgi:hypothetical protein
MTTPTPCWHCDGTGTERVNSYPIQCRACAETEATEASSALDVWNTRAPDPRVKELEARIARLEEVLRIYNIEVPE